MTSAAVKIGLGTVAVALLIYGLVHFGGSGLLESLVQTPQSTAPQSPNTAAAGMIGEQAPQFSLPDLVGNTVLQSSLVGTPRVIVFWATWNDDSTNEIKVLDGYLASGSPESHLVHIAAIDSEEDASIVSSFMYRGGYQVPVLVDAHGDATAAYNVKSLPTFYFINSAGVVKEVYVGTLSQQMLSNKIENILP